MLLFPEKYAARTPLGVSVLRSEKMKDYDPMATEGLITAG